MWRHCRSLNQVTSNRKPQRNFAPVGVRLCMCAHTWESLFVNTHVEGRNWLPHHVTLDLQGRIACWTQLTDMTVQSANLPQGLPVSAFPVRGVYYHATSFYVGVRDPISSPHTCTGFIHWASPSSPSSILPVRSFQHYYSNVKPSQHPHYFPFPCLLAPLVFPSFHCSAFLQIFNVIIIFVISISHILFLFYGWTSLNCVRIPMTVLTSQQCLWMVLPGPEQWLNG